MNCPNCQKNLISFARVLLLSGMVQRLCPGCGAHVRIAYVQPAISIPLRALSSGLAGASVVLGFRSLSWLVFIAIFAVGLAVSAFTVSQFGRLELDASQSQPDI